MAACSSVPAIEWTRSLKENPKLTMKDSIVLSRSTKHRTVALLKATSFSVKDLSKTMKVNMKLKFSLLKLICFATFR